MKKSEIIFYRKDKKGNFILSPKVFDELLSCYKANEEDSFTPVELGNAIAFVAMCLGRNARLDEITNTLVLLRRSYRPLWAIRMTVRMIALARKANDIYEAFSKKNFDE